MAIPEVDDLYPDITDQEYHADRGSLSSSGARRLLKATPAVFRWEQDHGGRPAAAALDFGQLVHTLVLGVGAPVAVLDPNVHGVKRDGTVAQNPSATSAWQAAEAEARANGETPVHIDDYTTAAAMAKVIRDHPLAGPLFTGGAAELSGYWHDEVTGVRLRYRPDYLKQLPDGRWVCVDYKTTVNASKAEFTKSVEKFGYDQQQPWYLAGLAANGYPDAAFVFVAQEKTPPFQVAVHELDPADVALGAELNRHAIDIYADCLANDHWPGYPLDVTRLKLRRFAVHEREALLQ